MGSLNMCLFIGRLGRDPEVRYTQSGQAVANLSIATDNTWKDKQGNKKTKTIWVRLVAWGKQAELCGEYLSTGRQIFVETRFEEREWKDKDGNDRKTAEFTISNVQFLDSNGNKRNLQDGEGEQQSTPEEAGAKPDDDPRF